MDGVRISRTPPNGWDRPENRGIKSTPSDREIDPYKDQAFNAEIEKEINGRNEAYKPRPHDYRKQITADQMRSLDTLKRASKLPARKIFETFCKHKDSKLNLKKYETLVEELKKLKNNVNGVITLLNKFHTSNNLNFAEMQAVLAALLEEHNLPDNTYKAIGDASDQLQQQQSGFIADVRLQLLAGASPKEAATLAGIAHNSSSSVVPLVHMLQEGGIDIRTAYSKFAAFLGLTNIIHGGNLSFEEKAQMANSINTLQDLAKMQTTYRHLQKFYEVQFQQV